MQISGGYSSLPLITSCCSLSCHPFLRLTYLCTCMQMWVCVCVCVPPLHLSVFSPPSSQSRTAYRLWLLIPSLLCFSFPYISRAFPLPSPALTQDLSPPNAACNRGLLLDVSSLGRPGCVREQADFSLNAAHTSSPSHSQM